MENKLIVVYDIILHEFLKNKKIKRVMDFAYVNGFLWDFKFGNLGKIDNRIVMVDYGVRVET
jgi:hypothetical protein